MADTSPVAELLGCPFCGGAARIESNRDWHRIYAAHDDECVFEADDHALMYPAQPGYLIQIVEDWNRRAALASRPAEVDDLLSAERVFRLFGLPDPAGMAADYSVTKALQLLHEARAVLETWKDVAPAVSLCADIDRVLAEQYRQGQRDAVAADRARRGGQL